MKISEFLTKTADVEFNNNKEHMLLNSFKTFKEDYIQIFRKNAIKKYNILDEYLSCEYDESLFNFNLEKRYISRRKLIIDYSKKNNWLRFYSYANKKLYKPISISDIVEYRLTDEENVICSGEKGTSKSIRSFVYNKYICQRLELKISSINENGVVDTKDFVVLENAKRNWGTYTSTIDSLKEIFNLIDAQILFSDRKEPDQEDKEDEAVIQSQKEDESVYKKLIELKSLYDSGIIDITTYEEKKKK